MGSGSGMHKVKSKSVVLGIVTRNRASILPKALKSLNEQVHSPDRIVVVDDASDDATPSVEDSFPDVEWHRWATPRGYLAARNFMMETAGEEFYASLDDDAWFLDGDELALALETMHQDPKIGAVAFDILSPDRPERQKRDGRREVASFIGCGHVLRLRAIRAVGFYLPAPGFYGGEEKDLSLALLDSGFKVVKLNGVHVWHDKTLVARDIPLQHRSGVCNDLAMALRRTPLILIPFALAFKFFRHFQFSLKHDLLKPCLWGFVAFIKATPMLWRSRRAVKASTLKNFMRLTREAATA